MDASPLITATGVSTTWPLSVWLTYSTKYSSVLDATTMGTAVTSTGVGTASKTGEHGLAVEPVPGVDQPLVPSSLAAFTCTS